MSRPPIPDEIATLMHDVSTAGKLLEIYLPFLQSAFGTVALTWGEWLRCVAVASSVLWLRELSKVAMSAIGRSN